MVDHRISEGTTDFLKGVAAMGPPGASIIFGITLEEWMFIASIVASIFIVLDKLPSIVERIREKFKKQSSTGSTTDTDADSSG